MEIFKVRIFHPFDPLGLKVGGPETFIKGFIKYAPDDLEIDLIGISSDKRNRTLQKWTKKKIGHKEFKFFPLFYEKNENQRGGIPLSLRFTISLKLAHLNYSNQILIFNRIEPAVLFRRTKCPKLAIIHNDVLNQIKKEGSEVLWGKFSWLYFILEAFAFSFLDHIYTVSSNTLEYYCSNYKKEKFSFIPTWVDTEIFHPKDVSKSVIREKLISVNNQLPISRKWILFVGRLQEQKAPLRMLDTFHAYYQKDKQSCLIIIGEGNLRKEAEEYGVKLDLIDNLFFLGNVRQEILADFYRAADVLLLTSNYEGMPMCVLEALGCGLPVVTTSVGEVKRVVFKGKTGEIVEGFVPEAISESVRIVLKNRSLYTETNCLNSVSEYTPQKIFKPMYEEIRNLKVKKI